MSGTLTAFYDLKVSPTGFDFVTFLALAEIARRRKRYTDLRVVFVPNDTQQFWKREQYAAGYKSFRLENLLVPMCGLYPSCHDHVVCASRGDAEQLLASAGGAHFPAEYRVSHPVEDAYQWANLAAAVACGAEIPAWTVPQRAREEVATWLAPRARGRKVISITLRQASYFADQNSNAAAWGEFARTLDASRYVPIVLRDTEVVHDPAPPALEGLTEFPEGSLSVLARAALYQQSYLNLMSAGGPMLLMWTNPECRSIVFKLLNRSNFRSTPIPLRSMGLDPGRQPITAGKFQEIVWQADDANDIAAAFARMVDRLEGRAPILRHAPESPLLLARRLRKTARYDAARTIYRHIAETDSNRAAAAQAGLAMVDFRLRGRPIKSRLIATIATRSLAGPILADPDALIECAEFRRIIRDRKRAALYYSAALKLDPEHPDAAHGLGRLALEDGLLADGEKFLRAAVRFDPYGAQVYYDLGEALLALGRDDEARTAFQVAADHDPSHEAARHRLKDLDGDNQPTDRAGPTVGQSDLVIPVRSSHRGHDVLYCNGSFYVLPIAGGLRVEPFKGGLAQRTAWRRRSPVRAPQLRTLGVALERIEERNTSHRLDDQSARYRGVLAEASAIASGLRTISNHQVTETAERLYELMICRSLVDTFSREVGLNDSPSDDTSWRGLGAAKLGDIEQLVRSLRPRIGEGNRSAKWLAHHVDAYFNPANQCGQYQAVPLQATLFADDDPAGHSDVATKIRVILAASGNLQQFESYLSALMFRSGDYHAAARYFVRAGNMPPISIDDVKKISNWLFLLIEGYRGHNVLYFSGEFVAVPQSLGRIDADFARSQLFRLHSILPARLARIVQRLPHPISSAISRLTQKRASTGALLTADSVDELLDHLDAAQNHEVPAPRQLAEAAAK